MDEGKEAAPKRHPSHIRSTNLWYTIDDETKILWDWCEVYGPFYGMTPGSYYDLVRKRLERGVHYEVAITRPPRKYTKAKRSA